MKKRPNPAVVASERAAKNAEDMAEMATHEQRDRPATAAGTKALAEKRRSTANKIKKEKPYLIEE